MKYLVIIYKHHDGFCLWHSHYTDYDIVATPFGRDVYREFTDAERTSSTVGSRIRAFRRLQNGHLTAKYAVNVAAD